MRRRAFDPGRLADARIDPHWQGLPEVYLVDTHSKGKAFIARITGPAPYRH
jgi:hypothetical protein